MELEKKTDISKNRLVIGLATVLVLFLSLSCGYITYHYNDIKYWNNLIYPGVMVQGIDLSGKTKTEALAIIKQVSSDQVSKGKINITEGERRYTLSYSELSPKYNTDLAVNEAYTYGKNFNLIHRYILLKNPRHLNYKLEFSYKVEVIKHLIENIENDINREPINATLDIAGDNIAIIPEQSGRRIERDKLEKEILSELDKGLSKDIQVSLPIQTIDSKIKEQMIKSVNSRIGSFSTNFGSISSAQRANNIVIATKSINGKILMPGDVFSFNDVVGERTEERGYEAAPVIIDNKLESGLGGGICQVSSTLYNAVYKAGITSLERTHHTLPVHYVSEGMDATVDYGNIDYKFKNTLSHPIYIQANIAGGNIIFNLYSNIATRK